MKNWFSKLFLAGLALVALSACETDLNRLVLQPGGSLAVTPSANTVTLSSAQAANDALTLTWTPVDYGYQAAVTYTVQMDRKGNDFKTPVEINAGNQTRLTLNVADLNQNLLKLGLAPGNAGQVDIRVKSDVGSGVTPVFSAPTTLTGTPYLVVIDYPSIFVPGGYQGWAPDKAPKLASVKNNNIYEGYVYFSSASEFKFTPAPNWDNDFGAGSGAGKLAPKGGNLKIDAPGYYLIRVDLNALTWSATRTEWGVIGAATPRGWDASTPMTFDAATNTWRVTVALKQDEIKFRANNAWDINFGDDKADGFLEYGATNIKVPAAGTYTVVLDLSKAGNYTYSLTRQ